MAEPQNQMPGAQSELPGQQNQMPMPMPQGDGPAQQNQLPGHQDQATEENPQTTGQPSKSQEETKKDDSGNDENEEMLDLEEDGSLTEASIRKRDNSKSGKLTLSERLYDYLRPDGLSNDDWAKESQTTYRDAINKDYELYAEQVGRIPDGTEEEKDKWKTENLENLFAEKFKVIYAYRLADSQRNLNVLEFGKIVQQIFDEEDGWDVERPHEMTDQQWSEERKKQIEELKEEDRVEEENIKKMQEEAAAAAISSASSNSTILPVKNDVPEKIRKQQDLMCPIIYSRWENPLNKDDTTQQFVNYNRNLSAIDGGKEFHIAPTQIDFWFDKLRKALVACEDEHSEDHARDLIAAVIQLTNVLRKAGLDWKMIMNEGTHRRMMKCVRKATLPETRAKVKDFEDSYLQPRQAQLDSLTQLSLIDDVFPDSTRMFVCARHCSVLNERLRKTNLNLGLRATDHYLPVENLELASQHFDAKRSFEGNTEVKKFLYKLKLLSIPGLKEANDHYADFSIDTGVALDEVMGILTSNVLSNPAYDDVPGSGNARRHSSYPGVPMETVGWLNFNHRTSFINKYGKDEASIFKIEHRPSAEWLEEHGKELPKEKRLCVPGDRLGDLKRDGKFLYDKDNIHDIYGVAFVGDDPRVLDPREYVEYWQHGQYTVPSVCILIGWDENLTGKDPVYSWETRSALRGRRSATHDLTATEVADFEIAELAQTRQNAFKERYLGGEPRKNESSGILPSTTTSQTNGSNPPSGSSVGTAIPEPQNGPGVQIGGSASPGESSTQPPTSVPRVNRGLSSPPFYPQHDTQIDPRVQQYGPQLHQQYGPQLHQQYGSQFDEPSYYYQPTSQNSYPPRYRGRRRAPQQPMQLARPWSQGPQTRSMTRDLGNDRLIEHLRSMDNDRRRYLKDLLLQFEDMGLDGR